MGKYDLGDWKVLYDEAADNWCICNDVLRTRSIPKITGHKYTTVGTFHEKQEAENFVQMKELGFTADAIAFLACEHSLHLKNSLSKMSSEERQELTEKVSEVKDETSRICFGKCKSLSHAPACATCYKAKPDTWTLCAIVKCVLNSQPEQ